MARMALLLTTIVEGTLITAGSVIDTVLEADLYAALLGAKSQLLPYVGAIADAADRANAAKLRGVSTESLDSIMVAVASVQALTADHVSYDDTLSPIFGVADVQSVLDIVKSRGPSTATPANVAATGSAGTGTLYSKSNHVHAHADLAGGSLHATAIAGTSAGFLSAADKLRLDGMATGATNTPLSAVTPQDLGAANAGSGTSASKNDHVHAHGSLLGGSLHATAIAGTSAGFLSAADKSKLDGLGATITQDIYYISPVGSDTTGNGSEGAPYATLQKCYDTWFPTGTPTTWAEFDRKRVIRCLPGVAAAGAGNLAASCCNLVIEGYGTIGAVTYDVKSEVMAGFTGASTNYESNTLHFRGGGFGWNSSSADAQLITGDITVSNFNAGSPRELQVTVESCQVQLKSQCRSGVPGGAVGPTYVRAQDAIFIYCETGVNALGNAPVTFAMAHHCIFRNQVNATKGAIGFADMQGCYFRRGFVGDPGINSMVSTGGFRGWEVNHIKYAFDVSSAGVQELQMDYSTWKYIQEQSSPNWGSCTVKLTNMWFGATGSRPSAGRPVGAMYYDTTINKPIWWNGAAWVDATGTSV